MSFSNYSKFLLLRPLFIFILIAVFCLPTLYIFQAYWIEKQTLQSLEEEFSYLEPKLIKALQNKNHKRGFFERYKESNHLYCEKFLEKLSFQHEKTELMQKIQDYLSTTPDKSTLPNNTLNLCEKSQRSAKSIHEIELSLMKPILVNTKDLQHLLTAIENCRPHHKPPKGCPQLTLKRFDLKKHSLQDKDFAYRIDFELIKREAKQ